MALGSYGMAPCYQCAVRGQSYCSCLNALQAAQNQMLGAIAGNAYISASSELQWTNLAASGPAIAPPAKSITRKRCIEKLREEISEWHGSILKS